jgi:hypothetical protein
MRAAERDLAVITKRRATGASTAEYVAVMLGLIAAWRIAAFVLRLIREHHAEFSWALSLPF